MSIKIKIDNSVLVDGSEVNVAVEVKGHTVGECLAYAVKQQPTLKKAIFDDKGNLSFGNFVRVNGEFIISNPEAKLVKDGDEIGIIKLTGG